MFVAVRRGLRDPVVLILILAGIFDGISGNPIHSILLFGAALVIVGDAPLRPRSSPLGPESAPDRSSPDGLPVLAERGQMGSAITELLRNPAVVASAVVSAVLYSVVVGKFGRYSWPATVAVVVPGATVLALMFGGPLDQGRESPRLHPVGVVAWLSVFVGLALWELTSLLLQPSLTTDSYAHPTLSVLSDPILATHPGRSLGLFLWLAFGWFLVQR